MNTPAPTPYDISDIPHIAFSPGLLEWGVLTCALGTVLVLWFLASKRIKPAKLDYDAYKRILAFIDSTLSKESFKSEHVAAASLQTKEFLGLHEKLDLSSMSVSELEELSSAKDKRPLGELLLTLGKLDHLRYGGSQSENVFREELHRLKLCLNNYVKELSAREVEQ